MPLKVIESKKEYDWSVNKPVEFRPFIKNIAGRKRLFVLGTVAAVRDSSKQFDGAATPDLALVDAEYRDVIWIDAKHPSQWTSTILKQLGETWKASERIPDSVLYPKKKDLDMSPLQRLETIEVDTVTAPIPVVLDSVQKDIPEVVADSLQN